MGNNLPKRMVWFAPLVFVPLALAVEAYHNFSHWRLAAAVIILAYAAMLMYSEDNTYGLGYAWRRSMCITVSASLAAFPITYGLMSMTSYCSPFGMMCGCTLAALFASWRDLKAWERVSEVGQEESAENESGEDE